MVPKKKGHTWGTCEKPSWSPQLSKETRLHDTVPGKELLNALTSIRLDPKYSDLTIICGHNEYAVHKCIVCTRSDFFSKACDSGFEESSSNRIILQEDPALVEQMIEYFYSLDYRVKVCDPAFDHDIPDEMAIAKDLERTTTFGDHSSQQSEREVDPDTASKSNELAEVSLNSFDPLSFHILMYSLADRMFIEGLKAISKDKVERELSQRLDPDTFPLAILEIYNSTPATDRGLRDLAVKMTMSHLTELRTGDECDRVVFPDSLVTKVPQFSSDLLVAIMNRSVSDWHLHGKCVRNWTQDVFWS